MDRLSIRREGEKVSSGKKYNVRLKWQAAAGVYLNDS